MNLGMGEIALLIVLALVLFGAKRLPEVGRAAGSAIREFKSALNGDVPKDGSGRSGEQPHEAEPRRDE
ncbi:MAG: twin-arginine translocase TatA/TatE family subunit [Synergistaceae bacterium]|jgi:sec-independent protein translocase protein TatA|nr:twin-arginine translocase TatA/TatE family subunit [Synergistaceae bacterium]